MKTIKLQNCLLLAEIGSRKSLFPIGCLDLGDRILRDLGEEDTIVADEARVSMIVK